MKLVLSLERTLSPQRPVAIAATKTLRPPDSRGATGRFYMRSFYILIYLLVTNIRLKSLLLFQCRCFLEAIDSQHCNCETCCQASLLCGAHSTTIDGEIEIPTKGGIMPTRDERRAEASRHLALMKGAFAKETQATIDAAVVYEDGDALALELPEPTAEATETQVTSDFTTTALRRAQGKTAIVDPVSYTRPGGAYEDGSFGPEQILCSESNLYPVLCGMKSTYHDQNRSYMCGMLLTSARCTCRTSFSFVKRDSRGERHRRTRAQPRAAPWKTMLRRPKCLDCLAARIKTMLNIAAANEIETLIVNAYACGRQASNPPKSSSFSSNGSPLTLAPSKPSCSPCRAQALMRSTRRSANPRPSLRRSSRPPRNRKTTNSTSAQSICPKDHHSLEAMQLSADQREPRANASQQEKRWMQH